MESTAPYVTFNNGNKFPQIGLGTFLSSEGEVKPIVKAAILDHGYRSIDTATLYQNEDAIGEALEEVFKEGNIKREEIFVATKLWHSDREDVEGTVRASLKKLKVEYIDLYMLHQMAPKMVWEDEQPIKNTPTHKVWAELERLVDEGLIKNLGVSNCTVPMLIDLWSYARHKPVINQVELHPYNVQEDFLNLHNKLGVKVEAYAPIGAQNFPGRAPSLKKLNLFEEAVILDLAAKYNKTPAQIILNWHLSRGVIIIPKTTRVGRLTENFQVYDFTLTQEEYASISALDQKARFFNPRYFAGSGWGNLPYYD